MPKISYETLVEKALLHVVPEALKHAKIHGLNNENHFYITFQTNRSDVLLSDELRASYPKEMTIVLQHEFYNLEIEEDSFSVTLSFSNVPEPITIPYSALLRFSDPSVPFTLSFTPEMPKEKKIKPTKTIASEDEDGEEKNILSFSAFRKKK